MLLLSAAASALTWSLPRAKRAMSSLRYASAWVCWNFKFSCGIGDHVRFGFIDTQFVDGGLLHDLLRGNAR